MNALSSINPIIALMPSSTSSYETNSSMPHMHNKTTQRTGVQLDLAVVSPQKILNQANSKLTKVSLQAVFAPDEPPNQIWINVVDKTTGKVIQQLPPTSIRKFISGQSLHGILIDQKL